MRHADRPKLPAVRGGDRVAWTDYKGHRHEGVYVGRGPGVMATVDKNGTYRKVPLTGIRPAGEGGPTPLEHVEGVSATRADAGHMHRLPTRGPGRG